MLAHAKRWLLLVPLLALPLMAACSGGGKSSNSNVTIQSNSSSTNVRIQQSSSGGSLSDCDYATSIESAFYPILGGVFDLLGLALSATPGPSGASTAATAAETQAINSLATSANQSVSALKAINPPSDFKAFHTDLTNELQSFADQLKTAQQAISSGDQAKADQILNGLTSSPFEDLNTKYPQQTQRLDACPTPVP